MTKNPYESPIEDDTPPPAVTVETSWFDITYIPLVWAFLLFALFIGWGYSASGDVPAWVKIVSSVFTAAALVILAISIRGWRRWITAPLWAHLIWVQYLVWTFYADR